MSTLSADARRLRVKYSKGGRLAHLGHLEVTGTIMRSVRRAHLPFEVGNGFARRMRIQFSQALPVGAASLAEYFDLMIPMPIDADEALNNLRGASPSLLMPTDARVIARRVPALEAWANRSIWTVDLRNVSFTAQEFERRLAETRDRGYIEFMRGDKPRRLELAHTLVAYEAIDVDRGISLRLDSRSTPQGSLRPAVLVEAVMGCKPQHVCRIQQWHEEEDGSLRDPLDMQSGN